MEKERRVFVVIDRDPTITQVATKLAADLAAAALGRVYLARPASRAGESIAAGVEFTGWPDSLPNDAAVRNWINKSEFAKRARYLHVIDGSTEIVRDVSEFINQLEQMMDVLDYSFWLSTSCDRCNYVYSKYCPRATVELDDLKYAKLGLPKQLVLTSHSNLQWVAYDMDKASDSELRFDEDFSIAMYEIIEALARRKACKTTQPYFMNQYITVPAEAGTFRVSNLAKSMQLDQTTMHREDELFKAKGVKHGADNAIDEVMSAIKAKLDEKIA